MTRRPTPKASKDGPTAKAVEALLAVDEEGVPLSQFLRYMRKRSTVDCGCWVWGGGVSESGVPVTHRGTGLKRENGWEITQTIPGRRAVVEHIAAGPMPQGFVSALLCETKLCVNPFHIMRATKPVQAAIAARRGSWKGAKKGKAVAIGRRRNSRFNDAVIDYVRASPKSCKDVAAEVGMSISHASRIRLHGVRKPLVSHFAGLGA